MKVYATKSSQRLIALARTRRLSKAPRFKPSNASSPIKVPLLDLKAEYEGLRDEILPAIDRTCQNSAFVEGPEVQAFEREFADFCGTAYCVALSSGTAALHLGLLALGVQAGDEVITTPNTFLATAEAITYCGARP